MTLDVTACLRAMRARDPRFDGVFFVGVTTTGVYCRPVCPARTPRAERCQFFGSAVLAEKAGFRACFRCRPELAPGSSPHDAVPRLVSTAVRRIEEGALNRGSVDDLAGELGVSSRQLRRSFESELGVTPKELAQSRRLAMAKRLLQDSSTPVTDVALLAGFASVRRFNAAFSEHFGRPPSALRKERGVATRVRLRLDYRPPFDWDTLLAFLGDRSLDGIEAVGDRYERTLYIDGHVGRVSVFPDGKRNALLAEIDASLGPVLMTVVARLRHLFDLDARPDAVAAVLGPDPILGPLVRARPGLRVPGAADPVEAVVRGIIGQQITVKAARTIATRLVRRFGVPVGEHLRFPTATELSAASIDDIAGLGMPARRAETLRAAARTLVDGFDLERLAALPGIGPWTRGYFELRVARLPDAFPAGDAGLHKALGLDGKAALARAEAWRPWRSYAAIHLWTSLGDAP